MGNRINSQLPLHLRVCGLRKLTQPPPKSARWVSDQRRSTRPTPGVTGFVPHIASSQNFVMAVGSRKQHGHVHSRDFRRALYCGYVHVCFFWRAMPACDQCIDGVSPSNIRWIL